MMICAEYQEHIDLKTHLLSYEVIFESLKQRQLKEPNYLGICWL